MPEIIPAWEELAAAALEPNVFYEHWMLLPALEAFGAEKDICVVLVLIHDTQNPAAPAKLGGLFPLERLSGFRRLPVSCLSLWRHVHCYLCTPLIRADAAHDCLIAFFHWLRRADTNASLMELGNICGYGPVHRALIDIFNDRKWLSSVTDSHTRGLLRWNYAGDSGLELPVSGSLRRTLRRKEKRLNERGRVEHIALRQDDDIDPWIDDFLRLEASGWKGQRGSALACSDVNRTFFMRVLKAAFQRERLLMIGIDFDGRPIARRCGFSAGEGSFAFKTAYDEEFSRFSPGVMLEVDNIRQVRLIQGMSWMDSCTDSDNFIINRLWNDRRVIQTMVIGGGAWGDLVTSVLPMLRWIRRRVPNGHSKDIHV